MNLLMRTSFASAALILIGCASAPAQSLQLAHEGMHAAAQQDRLCDALATIGDGERRAVTLSGIYVAGFEQSIFYDPNTPTCEDVQSETWVEFAPGLPNGQVGDLKEQQGSELRKAYVTFSGELYGPGVVGPDDVSFPQFAAFANRTRNRRYGHMNGYRTKFVVTSVADVKNVPDSVPSPIGRSPFATPIVRTAEVPQYPEMAWNAGITGDVVIEVAVTDGRVSKAEVKSGDRMLASEAVRNVEKWQFAVDVNAAFITTFSFNVERRNTGASTSPRIELDLPKRVRITAARNGW